MIHVVEPGTALNPELLVGRIVLRNAGLHWDAVSGAMRVTEVVGKILMGFHLRFSPSPDARGTGRTGYVVRAADRDDTDRMQVRSVTCVCDTAQEVVALLHLREDAADAFVAVKRDATANLRAMNGVEVPDVEEPAPRM